MDTSEGRKLALIIGNSQYQDQTLRQLITPGQDAEALACVLADVRIGGFEVKTLINRSATEILQEIEGFFADRKRDDLLLVYFSGHGIKDDAGRLFLATPDTQRNRLRATAIPAPFIHESMEGSRSRRQVLILDCCHSGAFPEGMIHKGTEKVGIGEQFKTGRGRVILTASNAIQYAFEGGKIERVGETTQSVFTRHLVRGLETGEADRNRDGLISLDELYDYVHDQVTSETPQQTPEIWQFGVEGDIVIARNPNPPPPVTSPVTPDEVSDSVARRRIQALWTDALDFFYTGEWTKARDTLKRVIELQPDFRDAADKLREAERQCTLAELYENATTAEAVGHWEEAIGHYVRVIELDASYRDAAAKVVQAKKQLSLARLYDDARALARDERWDSVLGVFNEIDKRNPSYPDPDGLHSKAKDELHKQQLEEMYTEGLEALGRKEWQIAIQRFEALEREQRDYRQTQLHLAKAREQLAASTRPPQGPDQAKQQVAPSGQHASSTDANLLVDVEQQKAVTPSTKTQRPRGITLLAVVPGIIGMFGILISLQYLTLERTDWPYWLVGSALFLLLAYGLWRLKPWAWTLGLIVGCVLALFSILLLSLPYIGIIGIAISLVFIYYLIQPNVRKAFGRS